MKAKQSLFPTYRFVAGVDEDDLVVLVHTVLVHPVRVENPQVPASPSNTLLRHTPQTTLGLEVVDTLADGLTVGGTWITVSKKTSAQKEALTYPWGRASCGYPS